MATYSIVPSPKVSDTVVEPYNCQALRMCKLWVCQVQLANRKLISEIIVSYRRLLWWISLHFGTILNISNRFSLRVCILVCTSSFEFCASSINNVWLCLEVRLIAETWVDVLFLARKLLVCTLLGTLSVHQLVENSDFSFALDNEALYDICEILRCYCIMIRDL